MSYFKSGFMLAARVLDDPKQLGRKPVRELTGAEKKLARHMAHDGASLEQIQETIGIECHRNTFARKLARLNIRPRGRDKAHRGEITSLPPSNRDTNQQSFRARERGV